MTIVQKPNTIVEVTLPCQKDKPEEDRILWRAKALSSADTIDYEAELAKVAKLRTSEEESKALNDLIRRSAVGWVNVVGADGQPLPFSDDSLNLFSPQQKYTFARELPSAAGWGDVQSKKSQSPSP